MRSNSLAVPQAPSARPRGRRPRSPGASRSAAVLQVAPHGLGPGARDLARRRPTRERPDLQPSRDQPPDQRAADEAGPAGDERSLDRPCRGDPNGGGRAGPRAGEYAS